jgi:serine/threonine protein kinase
MGFHLGRTIGDYEFIDVVGSSRSGVAYKVRNLVEGRFELLMVLSKPLQDDQEHADRFLREARVHGRLAHPNIVRFYGATVLDGQFVITTELIEGTALAQRLELGPISLVEAVSYFSQALSGLGHAHRCGVVHRDLTPENLIVTPEGTVKIAGFNLAKAATDPQLTQAGAAVGVLHYMAPEQVKGEVVLDARCDIYSLGVVLYEALTGKKPFDYKSQFDVMLAHVNKTPLPPSRINPELTPEIDAIVLKAMAKEPSQRFQTASEFRDALRRARASSKAPSVLCHSVPAVAAPAATPVEAGWTKSPVPPSSTFPQFLLLGLLIVVVAAAALLAFRA